MKVRQHEGTDNIKRTLYCVKLSFLLTSLKEIKTKLMISPRCLFICMSLLLSVRLSVCPPVCVCPTNNFWINWEIFIKYGREIMPLKTHDAVLFNAISSTVVNGRLSNFWGAWKICTSQLETMKFCILINLQMINNFYKDQFCEKHMKLEDVWKLKSVFRFMGTTHEQQVWYSERSWTYHFEVMSDNFNFF
jgi:hypothetical protein